MRTSLHNLKRVLSSAFFEWFLIFLLFINSIFSYVITEFAHYFRLEPPCLLCSRLDHSLANKKVRYYHDLICKKHKFEISSLVYCHAHDNLVDVHEMCETCLFSFATTNKSNAETYRLLVGKIGEESLSSFDDSETKNCACCNKVWIPKKVQKLIRFNSAGSEASDPGRHSEAAAEQPLVNNELHHLAHVGYTELKVHSDSDNDETTALILETNNIKDLDSEIATRSIDFSATEKLIKPSSLIPEGQSDVIKPQASLPKEFSVDVGHGLEELSWQQIDSENDPSVTPSIDFSATEKLIKPSGLISEGQSNVIKPQATLPKESSVDVGHGLEELSWQQIDRKNDPSVTPSIGFSATEKLIEPSSLVSEGQSDLIKPQTTVSEGPSVDIGHGLEELSWKQIDHKNYPAITRSIDFSPTEKLIEPSSSISEEQSDVIKPQATVSEESSVDIGHGLEELSWQHIDPKNDPAVTQSIDFPATAKLIEHSSSISEGQSNVIKPQATVSEESSVDIGHGLEEQSWQQVDLKNDPSMLTEPVNIASPSDIPTDISRESTLVVNETPIHLPEKYEIPPLESCHDRELSLELWEDNNVDLLGDASLPLDSVGTGVEEESNSCVTSSVEAKETTVIECEELHEEKSRHNVTETVLESNPGPQAINTLDLSGAYQIVVANKGKQHSDLLAEKWTGKDFPRLSGDLKSILSQVSAARGIEQFLSELSPRVSLNMEDLKTSRIYLERNESNLSFDGSSVGEIEGENEFDRLKRQVEHDKKLLSALYKELEEERNASAISTNQAMAMITRVQEEKATFQMEALQNLRMMEEQAEYDVEALQTTHDLLLEKDKIIQELESELDAYRSKFNADKNSTGRLLSGFEDERSYILESLEKINKKLRLFSNNGIYEISVSEGDRVDSLKSETDVNVNELPSIDPVTETDLASLANEVCQLSERLKSLKADQDFLEHSINSLRYGDEGIQFIKDIAIQLEDLRRSDRRLQSGKEVQH